MIYYDDVKEDICISLAFETYELPGKILVRSVKCLLLLWCTCSM